MLKISRYVLYDIARNKVVLAYTLFLLLVSLGLFQVEENPSKALLSLLNIILIVVPLVSMVFATIHWYNSYEFLELLLTQPLGRNKVLLSEWAGIGGSLTFAFVAGVGVPVLIYGGSAAGVSLLVVGVLLTLAFTSLAFLASVCSRDKARGIGAALLLWFFFALIYDGLVLLILFAFSDYPLEGITLALSCFNPVDLGRIYIMLHLDVSALMGYTGAVYKDFLGTAAGMAVTLGILALWVVLPLAIANRIFRRKDL
ncbi:ABC transporter permease subunit [Flaviaesturariibacter amylovorans]|uniref:ABC transporter permease subunit n=1 Tax=Flaviaesturariibacter amylovorans TaxID=1084520 RepID=A0ABP8H571_9BACT